MARKTVLVCDNCGKEVGEGKGATLRLTYSDARRGAKQADLCDNCAGEMPGRAAARRGRRPKAATRVATRGGLDPALVLFPALSSVSRQAPSGPRSTMGRLGLTLVTGPANAGKVAPCWSVSRGASGASRF